MTRQMSDIAQSAQGVQAHITSLNRHWAHTIQFCVYDPNSPQR